MPSTRASSPMSESDATSPAPLTPTSKVKALMAAFDDDSDTESISAGPARARIAANLAKLSPPKASTSTESKSEELQQKATQKASESASEDEEDVIVRPKGRVAARMQANSDSTDEGREPSARHARERVSNMLLTKSKSPTPNAQAEETHSSSESDVPVVSRKRKLRVARDNAHIDDTSKSSPARRSASPGLFVSPSKPVTSDTQAAGSDSDVDLPATGSARFNALVAKKRQERLAKEAEAAKEKARHAEERRRNAEATEGDGLDDSEGDRRLTQSSRPARKASKKALEEMHRETQRLSRNMQLAHKATTKKKFTKADFFAKFNQGITKGENLEPTRPTSSSSAAPHSDYEHKDTPPSSPTSPAGPGEKSGAPANRPRTTESRDNEVVELPTSEEAMTIPSSPPTRLDKGKGKAIEEPTPEITMEAELIKKPLFTQRPIRVRVPKVHDRKASPLDDSDSDLEIVSVKTIGRKQQLDSIFDRVPAKLAKEPHSLHALRMLAGVKSPGKQHTSERKFGRRTKLSMTTSELQMSLQQRARQQATRDREERIKALRDKGVVIQTAEERAKDLAEVEDIVAKARLEGEAIAKREKAQAKKERQKTGEADPLGDHSSDDEDYEEVQGVPEEEVSGSGSGSGSSEGESEVEEASANGSDEEEDEEMVLGGQGSKTEVTNSMFDTHAAESETEKFDVESDLAMHKDVSDVIGEEDEDEELPPKPNTRRFRNANVISDDEDEVVEEEEMQQTPVVPQVSPLQLSTNSPAEPSSVLRSATKTFIPGVTVAGPAGLGLTQIFAGTMDDSQAFGTSATAPRSESQAVVPNQNNLDFLRRLKGAELPPFVPTLEEDTQDADTTNASQLTYIPNSQPVETETQGDETQIQLDFSQSQIHGFDSILQGTQMSQFPPTQDVGYQRMTPIKGRFVDAPPSTVDTVLLEPNDLPETMDETPVVKRKGKLRQRVHVPTFSDDEDVEQPSEQTAEEEDLDITADVFDVMRKAATKATKKVVDEFDKKKSKAKEMVNEQADESDDEYAGLGGASDDESDGEADEFVKEMIDDEGGKHFDESKLAAFFADRERASDEKQVEKLYKDITNGMLRRKRGADYDLSDSDDGGEARQLRKRREFAKMRKALLADERIGKIAENPKRQAFLRAIEDRGSEDEMDFLEDFAEQEEGSDSQSQSQAENAVVPDSQPTSMGPPKRKHADDAADVQPRAPPHLRRTKPAKKPSNLSEIRESLSSLIEEPNALLAPSDSGSESEDELEIEEGDDDLSGPRKEKKEKRDPFALRRSKTAIVDRISLKRESSSSVSNTTKLAFAASSAAQGFKVPALLRRATTNSSITSTTSSSVSGGLMSGTERMAGGAGGDVIKRGGGRNSGINFAAREFERRAAVVKTDKRREEKMVGRAQKRRKVVGGLFGSGKFE